MQIPKFSASLRLLFILITLLIVATHAHGQLVGGSITGDVVDPGNAALDQARVLIRNVETGSERSLITGNGGTFAVPSIPVGVYTVSVEHDGFAPLQRTGIALEVGQNVRLHLVLSLGSVDQTVMVEFQQRSFCPVLQSCTSHF